MCSIKLCIPRTPQAQYHSTSVEGGCGYLECDIRGWNGNSIVFLIILKAVNFIRVNLDTCCCPFALTFLLQVLTSAVSNKDADPAVVRLLLTELRKRSCETHPEKQEINHPYKGSTLKMKAIQGLFGFLYRHRLSKRAIVSGIARETGFTALHYAARAGDTEIYKLLKDAGADPTLVTALGKTPACIYFEQTGVAAP